MKKRFIAFIILIFILVLISGCSMSGEDAMKIAEDKVKQDFQDLPDYEVRATKAVQYAGVWEIIVNVTIIEGLTEIDGYYLVKVSSKGEILSTELKKMGSFKT